jgi:uncharacterized protein YndB with AHSA1/START domain
LIKNTEALKGSKKRDLVFTRVFDAPVDQVWKAWTDSEEVKRWWGSGGFTCSVPKMDFREAGRSLVCMQAPKEFHSGQPASLVRGP